MHELKAPRPSGMARWLGHGPHGLAGRLGHFAHGHGGSITRFQAAMVVLFSLSVLFNVTDFLTSSFAVSIGLAESNPLLNSAAAFTGSGLLLVFGATKLAVMFGSLCTALLGLRSQNKKVSLVAFGVLAFFAGLYLFATLNNLYWIILAG